MFPTQDFNYIFHLHVTFYSTRKFKIDWIFNLNSIFFTVIIIIYYLSWTRKESFLFCCDKETSTRNNNLSLFQHFLNWNDESLRNKIYSGIMNNIEKIELNYQVFYVSTLLSTCCVKKRILKPMAVSKVIVSETKR